MTDRSSIVTAGLALVTLAIVGVAVAAFLRMNDLEDDIEQLRAEAAVASATPAPSPDSDSDDELRAWNCAAAWASLTDEQISQHYGRLLPRVGDPAIPQAITDLIDRYCYPAPSPTPFRLPWER